MSYLPSDKSYRQIIHRVPEFDEDGNVVGLRHFPTKTEAKEFARDQARRLDHKGYGFDSLDRDLVAELLDRFVPIRAADRSREGWV